jgi:predicted SnoaL-like aldol condensation-catalyzing enzyme
LEEANKALMRKMVEQVLNRGNLESADEIFASDYVQHDPDSPEEVRGPAGFKEFLSVFHPAFADLHVTIEDQIGEGENKMVTRYRASGTHRGDLMGLCPLPASG